MFFASSNIRNKHLIKLPVVAYRDTHIVPFQPQSVPFIARSAIYVGGDFWRAVHLFVCVSVTDFSHFLQGYLHWGQAYAYWCFDQNVKKVLL